MRERYVYDAGNGPVRAELPEKLEHEVKDLVADGYLYKLVMRCVPDKRLLSGHYMYAAAAEMVLSVPGLTGMRTLYEDIGRLFGRTMEAARRCMTFATFDYASFSRQVAADLSEKAFEYLTVSDVIGLFCDETIRAAAVRLE